jgi:acyl-CoA synthetase (AMP-forming)/AMP-acid ligase II
MTSPIQEAKFGFVVQTLLKDTIKILTKRMMEFIHYLFILFFKLNSFLIILRREEFIDGWFKTGDIGQLNSNGTISIIDRIKNLVKPPHGEYIAYV